MDGSVDQEEKGGRSMIEIMIRCGSIARRGCN